MEKNKIILKEELRRKLDSFIRKYYFSRLIKGLIYFIGLGIAYFLLVALLEHFGRFDGDVRLALLCLLIAGLGIIFTIYILIPLAGLARIGKALSYEKAARIIGKHFPEINDKITNTLELSKLSDRENRLVQASIDQRVASLNPIPFTNAVSLKENLRYWPVLVVPVLIVLFLLVGGQWSGISESSRRIIAYDKEFVPEAPFGFHILNENLSVERGQDFTVELQFTGNSIPASAQFISETGKGRFVRTASGSYTYNLENLAEDVHFWIEANGYRSGSYRIDVIPVPVIRTFKVNVYPPEYTGVKPFESEIKSVLDVPEGSAVEWLLGAETMDEAWLNSGDSNFAFAQISSEVFALELKLRENLEYSLITSNSNIRKESELNNEINIIRDEFPTITAEINQDSSDVNRVFFTGSVGDDYGFSNMNVVVADGDNVLLKKKLGIKDQILTQNISGILQLDSLSGVGEMLSIYLQVWDNDGVNGAKSARSSAYQIRVLSKEEQQKQIDQQLQGYFSDKEKLEKLGKQINEQLEALRNKLLNSKKAEWEDKEKVREILEKQQDLLKKQQELEKKRQELKKKEEKLDPVSEEIKEKEEQLDELRKQNKSDEELQELMKEIEELMEKMDFQKLQEKLQEMEQKSQKNQRSEERMDELMKDLEFQRDILKESERLEKLSEEMKELASEENQKGDEMQRQEEISKEFEESMEKLEELKEQDSNFKKATEEEKMEEMREETEEIMEQGSEQLQQDQQKKANESQQKSSEQMQEMSQKMMSSMMQMQSGQQQENMKTLRQILENLEILSFDVERLSDLSKKSGKSDPLYRKLLTDQRKLKDGAKVIEDSLIALGQRVPQIQEIVYEELDKIERNLDKSIQTLEEQEGAQSAAYQQHVMTASNTLALLLDQALRNMQQQMANMMQGNQSCQKPGSGKPSLSNMKKMQDELGKKMGQMKNGNKPGESQGKAKGRNGKEIVEMLSRQEIIRQQLQEYMDSKEEGQGGNGELKKALKEMEEIEKDLLDGNLTPESMERVKVITSRLLEAEKAEREQQQDEKRESKSSEEVNEIYQKELEEYLKEKENEREQLFTEPLRMKKYYKLKSNQYLNTL